MKTLYTLFSIVAVASTVVKADTLSDFGTTLGYINTGACNVIVNNPDNSRDTCLIACADTTAYL